MEERLREKQALSEVIRIALNRAQDHELLCQIGSALKTQPLGCQVVSECGLREDWRRSRETTVLQAMQGLSFAMAGEDLGHLLADQVRTLVQPPPPGCSPRRSSTNRALSTRTSSPYRPQHRQRSPLRVRNGPRSPGNDHGKAGGFGKETAVRSLSPLLRPSSDPQILVLVQMHKDLQHGLKRYATCGGESAARLALQEHIRAAQANFAARLEDVTKALADVTFGEVTDVGRPLRPESKLGVEAFAFGDLGLPAALVAKLADLRKQQAVRTVQRSVRKWLAWRDECRRAAEEQEHRLRQVDFRRNRAARRIQRAFRTEWLQQRTRFTAVFTVRQNTAAGKIQRAFRQLLRKQTATRKSAERRALERKSLREWKEKRAEEIEIQKKVFEALGMGDEVRKWIAAVRIQRKVRRVWAKRDARRRLWAVGVFQKWARGWGVRKEVWWHRALGKMRARRRELARLKAAKQATARSWTEAERALSRLVTLQDQARRVRGAMEEARAGFGVQWARWREGYERAASAQPLPRGWLRQMEPGGGECFVNTRTAERQALHPMMVAFLPEIEAQRARGEEALQARLAVLEAQLKLLEAAAEKERKAVLEMDKGRLFVSK